MSRRKRRDDDEPSFEQPDERPWTEEQWEKFMKESDARAARFGELLETLRDHPRRDVVVAREMGWDDFADELEAHAAAEAAGGGAESTEASDEHDAGGAEEIGAADDEGDQPEPKDADAGERPRRGRRHRRRRRRDGDEDDPLGLDEMDAELAAIPAYVMAMEVGERVTDGLKPWMDGPVKERRTPAEEDHDARLGEAFIGIHIAAAKLSGGHAMGYEDDALCGNIVNCKRALEGAEQSERALRALGEDGMLPKELVDDLAPRVREVADAIRARIAELRARVWW